MFFFAWVDPATSFNAITHSVQDENVFDFNMTHSEGDFPMLTMTIRNPRENLISPSRKLWAWLSQNGTPIFFGRLVALPENLHEELVSLNFIARPSDYDTTKQALADTLKVAPFWNPLWISDQRVDDPDIVLEARPQLWHIDRTTHAVTVSSITQGEDGLGDFDHFYSSLKVSYGSAPLRRVTIKATVSWDQAAEGIVDITGALLQAFAAAGSPSGFVSSYTGQGLENDWPKPFKSLRGGWSTGNVTLTRVDGIGRPSRSKIVKVDNPNANANTLADSFLEQPLLAQFFIWEFRPSFPLEYKVTRKRVENIDFTVEADVQSLVVDAGEDESEIITLSARADKPGSGGGDGLALANVSSPTYIKTDEGTNSFTYLLMLARAKLLARARAVNIDFSVDFASGLGLTCRQSARVVDPRLPGGEAIGKIVEYKLVATGEGVQRCDITIGCTIGEGNTVVGVDGDPTYVEASYVGIDYQRFTGTTFNVGDINYVDFGDTVLDDDGIDFSGGLAVSGVVELFEVRNGEAAQKIVLDQRFQDIPAAIEALNAKFTEVELRLKPLTGGPFETSYVPTVSDLMIPKTMEL